MNAVALWVFLPILAALGLWLIPRRHALVLGSGAGLALLLAVLANQLTFGVPERLGPLTVVIEPVFRLAGRQLILDNDSRPLLTLLYTISAFWLAGTLAAGGRRRLVPYGLGLTALVVAALAVRPGLYAALIVEAAIMISIPMLAAPGARAQRGILRFLVFTGMALPLFIIGSWALAGSIANPANTNLVLLTGIFLGLAFALLLAVFPLFTWMPMLADETHPYAAAFIFLFLPLVYLLLGMQILAENRWLRLSEDFITGIRLAGGLTVFTAGIWASFERNAGRLFGFLVVAQNGFSLLSLSLNSPLGDEMFVMMFLPRVVEIGLLGLALSVMHQHYPSLNLRDLRNAAARTPVALAAFATAGLSRAGLPLMAEFPIRFTLLQEIAVQHPVMALGIMVGWVGLLFSVLVFLADMVGNRLDPRMLFKPQGAETNGQILLLALAIAALFAVGIAPSIFFPAMRALLP